MEAGNGMMQPQIEECRQPREAGKDQEKIFAWNLLREHGPADTLDSAQQN